jgi:hypothetical protein
MHPFALSRADDPAKAIAAHARDPQLAFIAGGTDLIFMRGMLRGGGSGNRQRRVSRNGQGLRDLPITVEKLL